jgi:Tfp pilus assembly protein PilX
MSEANRFAVVTGAACTGLSCTGTTCAALYGATRTASATGLSKPTVGTLGAYLWASHGPYVDGHTLGPRIGP